jgi:hypothetical protein
VAGELFSNTVSKSAHHVTPTSAKAQKPGTQGMDEDFLPANITQISSQILKLFVLLSYL